MKCPICGRETRDESKFCERCGQKIPRCPTCGKIITKKMRFCTNDGTPLPPEILELLPDGAGNTGVGTPEGRQPSSAGPGTPAGRQPSPAGSEALEGRQPSPAGPEAPAGRQPSPAAPGAPRPGQAAPGSNVPPQKKKKSPLVPILLGVAAILFVSLACVGGYMAASGKLGSLFGQTDSGREIEDEEETSREEKTDRSDSKDQEEDQEETQAETTTAAEETTTAAAETTTDRETQYGMAAGGETTTAFAATQSSEPEDKLLYFIENSDREVFTAEYLESFDANMCRLARNGIYARLGRKFKDASIMEYFGQFDWYNPTIEPERFSDSLLNSYQVANRDLIVAYEAQKGYN